MGDPFTDHFHHCQFVVLNELYSFVFIVQCSGFLKSWQTSIQSVPVSGIDADVHLSTFACFIAVASPVQDQCSTSGNTYSLNNSKIKFECTSNQKPIPLHYSSRHTADAKYLFVDERYWNFVFRNCWPYSDTIIFAGDLCFKEKSTPPIKLQHLRKVRVWAFV